jgi:hypothetical protein
LCDPSKRSPDWLKATSDFASWFSSNSTTSRIAPKLIPRGPAADPRCEREPHAAEVVDGLDQHSHVLPADGLGRLQRGLLRWL